jgi:nitrogen fixation protein NifB
LLGEDLGAAFTLDRIVENPVFDPDVREIYMSVVDQERADRQAAEAAARRNAAGAGRGHALLVAVATKGGGRINQHFGHAREFHVLEVDGANVRFVGMRRTDNYCKGGYGEEDSLEQIIAALHGVSAVLVARIGDCPRRRLADAGITVVDDYAHDFIEASALAWWSRVNGGVLSALASA